MAKNSITRSSESKTTSKQAEGSAKDSRAEWIIKQVITLAWAWNEPTPEERLAVYAGVLMEVDRECLSEMFYHALRECEKFPSIAELLKVAKKRAEERGYRIDDVIYKVMEYAKQVANHGPGDPPVRPLGPRTQYAVERVGVPLEEISFHNEQVVRKFHEAFIEWAEQNTTSSMARLLQ